MSGAVPLDPVRPWTPLVSALMWWVGLSWMVPMLIGMALLSVVVPPWRTDWLNRLYCRGQLALAGIRWRAVVDPGVRADRPYLFAQNHTNHLDHVVLYPATPHFKQGVELESHFKIPVYGWFMRARGTIPVRPGSGGQSPEIMAQMRAELAQNHSILAFPEAHRTTDGLVHPFRKGIFFIARDLGLPVAPVAVTGFHRVMRKGSWHFRPGIEVVVHVLAPIETAGLDDEGVAAVAAAAQAAVSQRIDAYWEEVRRGGG